MTKIIIDHDYDHDDHKNAINLFSLLKLSDDDEHHHYHHHHPHQHSDDDIDDDQQHQTLLPINSVDSFQLIAASGSNILI